MFIKNKISLLIKDNYLVWLFNLFYKRCRYPMLALYSGVRLNRHEKNNLFNLRRNIHRLEKGLICPQQRRVFAEDYILETVNLLIYSYDIDRNTFFWGKSVLREYFYSCKNTMKISEAFFIYRKYIETTRLSSSFVPYSACNRPDITVQYNDLYQLARRRRSIRCYYDKKVNFDVVEQAMEIAKLSPSACNRQSFEFIFYNNQEFIKKVIEIPGGFVGYEAPGLIIVVGNYRGYFDERDMYVPFIDGSLAVMSFLFALETLGLSSVCINWPALPDRDKKIRELIKLNIDQFIIMLIAIGYAAPEGKIPYSAKLDTLNILKNGENV